MWRAVGSSSPTRPLPDRTHPVHPRRFMRITSLGHAGLLIETSQGSITCDPWFEPAFRGSWFVFPRNDRLDLDLRERLTHASFLYVSHRHGDHFDETFLRDHMDHDTTVLLPDYPTGELERELRRLGFHRFVRTRHGVEHDLGDGLRVAIHVETSITDGPGGDSALVVSDGRHRVVNQNDCRTHDLGSLRAHGAVDVHLLQHSGAIWYPMVYDLPDDEMLRSCRAKVASQLTRALRYVEAVDARVVMPSAGPPAFLDPELFHLNMISGDEASIFPDQTVFLERLTAAQRHGVLNIPGTCVELVGDRIDVQHPVPDDQVARIFTHKAEELLTYQADWSEWLTRHREQWHGPTDDLIDSLRRWWEPLLAMAPWLRRGVGSPCLLRAVPDERCPDGVDVLIDFPGGQVRPFAGETHRFRFDIPRSLVETVAAEHAVDWSNSLFLSCRFRAWREGDFNEHLYNFFKSLSVERMRRTEDEARRKLDVSAGSDADRQGDHIRLGDWTVERWCPHRRADLSVFGEISDDGCQLVCTLHGWRFELPSGRCLNAEDRHLSVRHADDHSG
jgi:UDP-MurNAc hydroxylase